MGTRAIKTYSAIILNVIFILKDFSGFQEVSHVCHKWKYLRHDVRYWYYYYKPWMGSDMWPID